MVAVALVADIGSRNAEYNQIPAVFAVFLIKSLNVVASLRGTVGTTLPKSLKTQFFRGNRKACACCQTDRPA